MLPEGAVECTVGIHKDVSKSMRNTLRKLIDIHMTHMFRKLQSECDFLEAANLPERWIGGNDEKDDVEVDEETSKALERLSWDKTVKGEA